MRKPKICAVIVDKDLRAVKEVEPLVDLFEVRIEGAGPLAVESTSQEALVDYIHHLACVDTEEVFFPFRVEYMKATGPDTPPEVARGTIFLDPSRIIIVGPERRPLAPIQPSEDFEALIAQISGPREPVEVILATDEAEDGGGEEGLK